MTNDDHEHLNVTQSIKPVTGMRPHESQRSTVDEERPSTTQKSQGFTNGSSVTIPGYEIWGEIARGGMGCVLDAHEILLDRPVAIKVLLPGISAQRFVNEALITARLPHPGIPPVYSFGVLEDGSHYLVMKRVWGKTLGEELANSHANTKDHTSWLGIFEQLAQAVGFAHSKHVIHRDLKPANVMLGAFGEVQVMDWGLAKILGEEQKPSDNSQLSTTENNKELTRQGTVMGTPAYMSPEQARGEPLDARTDVFALGAILYEMLTGERLVAGLNAADSIRKIASWKTHYARQRMLEIQTDEQLLEIACKCLAESSAERPANASEVATMISEHRRDLETRLKRAEQARVVSETRDIEQARRRRALSVAAAVLVVILVLGLIGTSIGFYQANIARAAEQERANGEKAAKVEVERRLEQLSRNNEILSNIFADLDARYADNMGQPLEAVLAKRLVAACRLLHDDSIADPLETAKIQRQLGETLLSLSKPAESVEMLEMSLVTHRRHLGETHTETLLTQANLAIALASLDLERATLLLQETYSALTKELGPEHMDTLSCQSNLGEVYRITQRLDEAIPLLEECAQRYTDVYGKTHQNTLSVRNNLSLCYQDSGRLDDALRIQQENVEYSRTSLGENHFDTLMAMTRLANTKMLMRDFQEAQQLLEPAYKEMSKRFGWDHQETLGAVVNLAMCYLNLNRADEAMPLLREAEKRAISIFSEDHPETVMMMNNLGHVLLAAGKFDEALVQFKKTRNARERVLGPFHRDTLMSMENIMTTQAKLGRLDEAIEMAETAVPLMKTHLGEKDIYTLNGVHKLAMICERMGNIERATQLCEEILPVLRETVGVENSHTYRVAYMLASLYGQTERHQDAISTLSQLHAELAAKLGQVHPSTLGAIKQLVRAHFSAGQAESATNWCQEFVNVQRDSLKQTPLQLAEALEIAAAECATGKAFAMSETFLRESLNLRQGVEGNGWMLHHTQAKLGAVLLNGIQALDPEQATDYSQRLQAAKDYLLTGFKGMQEEVDSVPSNGAVHLAECAQNIIDYYETVEEADAVSLWRDRLSRIKSRSDDPSESQK